VGGHPNPTPKSEKNKKNEDIPPPPILYHKFISTIEVKETKSPKKKAKKTSEKGLMSDINNQRAMLSHSPGALFPMMSQYLQAKAP
jgi:hypothetical protein